MSVQVFADDGARLIASITLAGETRDVEFHRTSGPSERGVSFYESVQRFVATADRTGRAHVVAMTALRTLRAHAAALGYGEGQVLPLPDGEALCPSHVVRVGSRTVATITGWGERAAEPGGLASA